MISTAIVMSYELRKSAPNAIQDSLSKIYCPIPAFVNKKELCVVCYQYLTLSKLQLSILHFSLLPEF